MGGVVHDDAAFAPRLKRILQRFHAGQVFKDEIRSASELVTLIEILRPIVGQLIAGNARDQSNCQKGEEPEQEFTACDDKGAEPVEESRPISADGTRAQRQDRKQRRMGHGVGILQVVESGELWIVFVEQASVIVRDADEAGAPGPQPALTMLRPQRPATGGAE